VNITVINVITSRFIFNSFVDLAAKLQKKGNNFPLFLFHCFLFLKKIRIFAA